MVTKLGKKPGNEERAMQSACFSLRPWHLQAIRQAALRHGASHGAIVRQALDRSLQDIESPEAYSADRPSSGGGPSYLFSVVRPIAKELAAIRRALDDLRRTVNRLEEGLAQTENPALCPVALARDDESVAEHGTTRKKGYRVHARSVRHSSGSQRRAIH